MPVAQARSAAMASQPAPAPEVVVYGVVLVGQDRSAFLAGPQLTEGRVRRVVPGTLLGRYRVSRIEADGIVLEKDGASLRVGLGGLDKPNRPVRLPMAATTEVSPVAMQRLSQELGLPLQVLEAQSQEMKLDPADLLIAHRLAHAAGLSVDRVVAEFRERGAWGGIARTHRVDVDELIRQVSQFRQAIESQPGPPFR